MRVEGAAAVVLAGGRSRRMGTAKARLEWHGSTLLHRTAALLGRTVNGPVVVVRAPAQSLPALPAEVEVVADPVGGVGPMEGIAAGLTAVADRAEVAFVCSTDLPFLHPALVTRLLGELAGDPGVELALPVTDGHRQPLAAAYRTRLATRIAALLAGGEVRPTMLVEHVPATLLDERALLADQDLARLDPRLCSLVNVNAPDDYAAARRRPPPEVVLGRGSGDPGAGLTVPAATLGAAAVAAGWALTARETVRLNGEPVAADPLLPLVTGDRVLFGVGPGRDPSPPSA